MHLPDFRCMRRGKQYYTLKAQDATLMAPIEKRTNHHRKALLMIHGFSSTPAVYRHFLDKLGQYDALIVPLLPGHGSSIAEFEQVKASSWIDAMHDLCSQLIQEFDALDVLGLSLGGVLATYLSSHFQLNHLYLLAPAFDLPFSISQTIKYVHILNYLGFRRFRNAAGNLYTKTHCEIAYSQLPLATVIELLTFIRNFQFKPPNCPTDIFLGRYDTVVDSKKIAARFSDSSLSKVHWLNHSAHVLPLDGDADYIVDCIKNELALTL